MKLEKVLDGYLEGKQKHRMEDRIRLYKHRLARNLG